MTGTPEAEAPEETTLYRIWGEADLLLYIGISKDFGQRWKQHAKLQPWWPEKRRLTADKLYPSRPEAEAAEEAAIKAERPKYNKKHLVPAARKPRRSAVKPAVVPEPSAILAETAEPRREEVPYPYRLLSFRLSEPDMGDVDFSTPEGRLRAAEVLGGYEKRALRIRSTLEKQAAEMREMEDDRDLQWAAPAIRKIRRNCAVLLGDGSSLAATAGDLNAGAILRETARLSRKLGEAVGAYAGSLEAADALIEDEALSTRVAA